MELYIKKNGKFIPYFDLTIPDYDNATIDSNRTRNAIIDVTTAEGI